MEANLNERLNVFFEKMRSCPNRVLLLDFDGTLSPFTPHRDQAAFYPGVKEKIEQILAGGKTKVIIVSGRSLTNLAGLVQLSPMPELWGSHGMESSKTGDRSEPKLKRKIGQARESIAALIDPQAIEIKPFSVAVHWRSLPAEQQLRLKEKILHSWQPFVKRDMEIMPFDGGLELRLKGANKGLVIKKVLEETRRPRAIAYLGDDLTDEDAFKVLKDEGLKVLVRTGPDRPTLADMEIQPPEELMEFFDLWIAEEKDYGKNV